MDRSCVASVAAMGSLDPDTRLAGGDGRFEVSLSPDWRIWGPNGGYLGGPRAARRGLASRFERPASFACHFLGVGASTPATIAVTPLRSARTAESLRATIEQNDRVLLDAQVWTVAGRRGSRTRLRADARREGAVAARAVREARRATSVLRRSRSGTTSRAARPTGCRRRSGNPARRCCAAGTASAPTRASTSRFSTRRARCC